MIAGSAVKSGTVFESRLGEITAHPYRLFGGYRLALAVMVLLSHSPGFLPAWMTELSLGNVGVFSFFILSGFVIAEALDVFYRENVKGFAINRFLKIYPTFWAASILAYFALLYVGKLEFPPDPLLVAVNFTILLGHTPFGSHLVLLTLAWAVIVELIFYIFMGVVIFMGRNLGRTKEILLISTIAALGIYLYVDYTQSFARSFSVFRFAPFFILGVAYYYVVSRRSMGAAVVLFMACAASLHSYWVYHQPVLEHVRLGTTVLFVLVNGCFARAAWLQCPAVVERVDKRMGDLTYGVYLCHMPVIWVMETFSFIPPVESLIVAVTSFSIAWIVFVFAERPMFRLRDKFRGARLYA